LIYAPPKALDEEDVQFFDEQAKSIQEKERLKQEQTLAEVVDFKSAQVRCTESCHFCLLQDEATLDSHFARVGQSGGQSSTDSNN